MLPVGRWLTCLVFLRGVPATLKVAGCEVLRAFTHWRKLCLDFDLLFATTHFKREYLGSIFCFSLSCWDATVFLMYGGAMTLNK